MIATALLPTISIGISFLVSGTAGSECCKAHYGDLLVADNDAMWCSDYCCHVPTQYYCCNDRQFRADSSEREGTCSDYFAQHVWIPILIALGCVGLIVCCCVCCCCCCCRQDRGPGTVFLPSAGSAPNVTVVNSSTNSMQSSTNSMPSMWPNSSTDPYRSGYDQTNGQ